MSNEAIILIARRIAAAYLQYKDHPCIANQVTLNTSLETLINETEDSERSLDPGSSTILKGLSQL